MIIYKDITFTFGETNLFDHFNYEIQSGEHVCIAGKSGVGKSTLINMLLGFLTPDSGEIRVDNQTLTVDTLQSIRSKILWLPQDINLPFHSVREMLNFPYTLKVNRKLSFNEDKALQLFDQLGLDRVLINHDISQISGGQKQRIAFISGIMAGKDIVLLDEPTAALDPDSTIRMGEFIKGLKDVTVLAISHDERFAAFFDRTLLLK
ncbi:MAG: ABC transporter ATP-binding protein [Bacteroidales bacterium]